MIGDCNNYVVGGISELYLTEYDETYVPIYSSNNVIQRLEWVTRDWYEIKLNTAVATYGQEMTTKVQNGIYYDEKVEIRIPRADNQKWRDLVDILTKKYIIVFRDNNGTYFIAGYRFGMDVRSYQLESNQYVTSFLGMHANNLPTFIESTYVLNNIIVSPTPTPTPSISQTPTPSITPSISISSTPSISVSPSTTPSISVSPSVTPSISVSISVTPSISITPSITPSPSPSSAGLVEIQVTNNSGTAGITNMKVDGTFVIDFQTVYPSDSYSFYTTKIGDFNLELTIASNAGVVNAYCVGSDNVPDCNDLVGNGELLVYSLTFNTSQTVIVDLSDGACI